ncbi:hypothetical protein OS493_005352 [Desmophyllum pertusum]|uniref:Major facilitator superfamily (MFS) profile domain-containing protein n=1 Tax=Desmophyllum pertusum TaxID=174260 RepID=A0A9W9YS44_9CNID|nr:hypothetical protein OS493_005352 [Desmophyllum pertusum]
MFFGILRSFGVLFPVLMDEFQTSREKTAWVGSLAISLTLFATPLVGSISEKFSCRLVMMVGALLFVVGLTATSFVHDIEVMFFTFSVLTGLGSCCCRTSCFLVVAKYFNKKRSFATGSITMGSSLGMFMWGPITQVLLDSLGWRNTFRVMAFSCTLLFLFAVTFNPNIEEKDKIPEEATQENSDNNDLQNDDKKDKIPEEAAQSEQNDLQDGAKENKILSRSLRPICPLAASPFVFVASPLTYFAIVGQQNHQLCRLQNDDNAEFQTTEKS